MATSESKPRIYSNPPFAPLWVLDRHERFLKRQERERRKKEVEQAGHQFVVTMKLKDQEEPLEDVIKARAMWPFYARTEKITEEQSELFKRVYAGLREYYFWEDIVRHWSYTEITGMELWTDGKYVERDSILVPPPTKISVTRKTHDNNVRWSDRKNLLDRGWEEGRDGILRKNESYSPGQISHLLSQMKPLFGIEEFSARIEPIYPASGPYAPPASIQQIEG